MFDTNNSDIYLVNFLFWCTKYHRAIVSSTCIKYREKTHFLKLSSTVWCQHIFISLAFFPFCSPALLASFAWYKLATILNYRFSSNIRLLDEIKFSYIKGCFIDGKRGRIHFSFEKVPKSEVFSIHSPQKSDKKN